MPLCRSAYDALMAGRKLDVVARFDRYGEVTLFCPACAQKADLVLAAYEWDVDDDSANFFFEGYLLADCVTCLEPRLAAAGLPPLQALLDQERQHRPMRSVKPPTPYELRQLFGECFHEGWARDAPTPDGALDAFLAAFSREHCAQVATHLDAFIAALPDEPALQRALREHLRCQHVPADGPRPAHDWLRHVSRRLRREDERCGP